MNHGILPSDAREYRKWAGAMMIFAILVLLLGGIFIYWCRKFDGQCRWISLTLVNKSNV
jgi:hypothetical protein